MSMADALARAWRKLRGQKEDPHQDQLMRLYWNRAELKKELSDLQEERHGLLAKLDAQQTSLKRAGEQVEELAAYLGRPEIGPQALLYFQLRALWFGNGKLLTRFVAELRQQQEERERRRHAADCAANRAAKVREIEEQLLNAQSIADSLDARAQLLSSKLAATKGFWRFRKRRELQAEIAQVRAQWDIAATNVTDLSDERAAVTEAEPEEFPGLSIEGRRIVNTAAIAYAEWLIARLPLRALAPLARQAISVQIYDAQLGSSEECARLMEPAKAALAALTIDPKQLVTLKEPTERVRARAVYRSGQDTVPLAESIGELPIGKSDAPKSVQERVPAKLNVLADDYWSIAQVLLQ
jgi:hypothetical protein